MTPILSRLFEKFIVHEFLYPVLVHGSCSTLYHDQYAFRPTGSTTAALINLVKDISDLLDDFPYVHVITFDISKAFDSLRHSTLMDKLADLPIPDRVYNWIVEYFQDRSHVTKTSNTISSAIGINASIVQGSGIGPMCYVLNSGDLKPAVQKKNRFSKYADDGDLVVPSINSSSIPLEVDNISLWAAGCNMTINKNKTKEMIIYKPGPKCHRVIPPCTPGIQRVRSMKILGIEIDETLSFKPHVDNGCRRAASSLYALKILRSKGLEGVQLWDVTGQTLIAQMSYASQVWWGFIDDTSRNRYESIIKRLKKLKYLSSQHESFGELCSSADSTLFQRALNNKDHVLHHLLPPAKIVPYDMRPRAHNRCLPKNLSCTQQKNFFNRMLYKDSY